MKKIIAIALATLTLTANAAGIEGKWRTIDDESKKPKAIITISQSGGTFSGRITDLAQGVNNVCPACSKPDTPLIGLTVLTGLKAESDTEYTGGRIYDPKSGKTYKSKATLSADGKTLKVRGYVGVSLLGRTQTWTRVQ